MIKFRKKPAVIEAFHLTKERRWDNSDWPNWLHAAWNQEPSEGAVWIDNDDPDRTKLVCGTLEGVHRIEWGDWIIQGVKGEIYACKPDIFEMTYEPAGEYHEKAEAELAALQAERAVDIRYMDELKAELAETLKSIQYEIEARERVEGRLDRAEFERDHYKAESNRFRQACIIAMDCRYVGPGLCNVCMDLLHKATIGE